jgi:hypothetical protein
MERPKHGTQRNAGIELMSNDDKSAASGHSLADLPPELAARVESELRDGEHLIWVGQPRPDLYARGSGCLVVFGLFFTAFAALWLLVTLGIGFLLVGAGGGGLEIAGIPFLVFGLFGLPFLLIGLGLLTAPLWNRKWARKVCYLLTDRRAITWEPTLFRGVTVRSFSQDGLGKITRQENPDGSGSLVFHEYMVSDSDGSTTHRQGFMYIDHVRFVEELLRRTLLE